MQQKTRELRIELLERLGEKKRRQHIEMARRGGAIVVDNHDGSVTVIKIRFVEAINGNPSPYAPGQRETHIEELTCR